MSRSAFSRLHPVFTTALLAGVGLACSGSLLGPASSINTVDTVRLYALSGTAISLPGAYSMLDQRTIRTDTTSQFDFAFDITAAGAPLIYPSGVLGLSTEPGLQRSTRAFDDLKSAPVEGYLRDSTLAVAEQDVFIARSRSSFLGCLYLGSVPRYGKFRVLSIDLVVRSVTFEALVNRNCGFKSLEAGLPES
ncbi:MAG TPA: hypothetical protein VF970_17200 [Gemmatimonadales bacterium]